MTRLNCCAAMVAALCLMSMPAVGQQGGSSTGTENGEWRHWGGDTFSTRYSPLDQINADNFEDLEVAWVWRGDNYGPSVDNIMRSTPIYANGVLYTVAGQRRTVVAIDPATGETVWIYPRALHAALGRLDAEELRQRRRVRQHRSPRCDLHDLARLLLARARRRHRTADRAVRRRGHGRPAGRLRV